MQYIHKHPRSYSESFFFAPLPVAVDDDENGGGGDYDDDDDDDD